MQGWVPWALGIAVAALIIAPVVAYDPPYEDGITLTGRFVNANGQPVRGQVEVWQNWDNGRSGNVNHWNIPGWLIPTTWTDEDGRFRFEGLLDYPENKSHRYYVAILPDSKAYPRFKGWYLEMRSHQDGDEVDWGNLAINYAIDDPFPETPPSEVPLRRDISVRGRVVNANGEPLKARVAAWQTQGWSSTPYNIWEIPGWRMPFADTDENGYFHLTGLSDHPLMGSHRYNIFFTASDPAYGQESFHLYLPAHDDGEVIDIGNFALNRKTR